MKSCSVCKIEKEISEFNKRKMAKDGLRSECRNCSRNNYLKNKEYHNNKCNQYYYENRDSLLIKMREYQQNNRDLDGKLIKLSFLKESINDPTKKICSKCLEVKCRLSFTTDNSKLDKLNSSCNTCKSKYLYNRCKIDPIYKLKLSIRSRISTSFRILGVFKDKKTNTILGCSYEEFRVYIESKFKDGMTLSNHGKWHLDHIIPISYAKSKEEVYKLNHYTNFQPLWAIDNLSKGNRHIG